MTKSEPLHAFLQAFMQSISRETSSRALLDFLRSFVLATNVRQNKGNQLNWSIAKLQKVTQVKIEKNELKNVTTLMSHSAKFRGIQRRTYWHFIDSIAINEMNSFSAIILGYALKHMPLFYELQTSPINPH